MEQVMKSDEQMVQGVWNDARCLGVNRSRFVEINRDMWAVPGNWATDAEAWSAAAAYTRERLEEVLQLREEIEMLSVCEHEAEHNAERAIFSRVIDRLESILAAKTAGMKEGA